MIAMSDTRPICLPCEVSMYPEKNGVVIKYSHDGFQNGDLYKCPKCGRQIIVGFGQVYHNWGYVPENSDDPDSELIVKTWDVEYEYERGYCDRE